MGDRPVPMAGGTLGLEDLGVDDERSSGGEGVPLEDTASRAGSPALAGTIDAAAIAPALTIGLSGVPLPGASVMELKASPVGSTPIRARTAASPRSSRISPYVKGLEIDWMVNGTSCSPTA